MSGGGIGGLFGALLVMGVESARFKSLLHDCSVTEEDQCEKSLIRGNFMTEACL